MPARFVVSLVVDPRRRVNDDVGGDDLAVRPVSLIILLWVVATASDDDGFEDSWVHLAFDVLQACLEVQLLLDRRLHCWVLSGWQEHLTVLLGVEFQHGLRSV